MTLEDIYTGALFAFGEMMKRGVTCVGDFFYLHNYGTDSDEAVIQAAKDLGMRLGLVRTMYDWDGAPAVMWRPFPSCGKYKNSGK